MGSLVSAMAFKELIFMAMVGVSMLACPNRDCSCADKSFGECNVPTTVANEVHTESRELCIANCDADDPCERYHQTNCVVNPKPTATFPATQNVDACRLACILDSASNPDTSYGGFDYKEETCMCYDSGDRDCQFEAIQFGVTETDIATCQA